MTESDPEILPRPAGARLLVRLASLRKNYLELQRRAAPALVAPVVKANGYGLGMAEIAKTLAAIGADTFFVARLGEAIALRALHPGARIFAFDGLAPGTATAFIAHAITPVLNTPEEIAEWQGAARERRTRLDAAIQIDTGMNRSGLSREDVHELAANHRSSLAGLDLKLIMSHLACAEETERKAFSAAQLARFRAALAMLPPAPASLANSAGIELGRDYQFDIVRPGIALYGADPLQRQPNPYATVAVLSAPVLQVRRVDSGETVGYGASFTAKVPMTLVTIAIGYADGLPRISAAQGSAALGGVKMRFVGRISMDLATLDAEGVLPALQVPGAEVEIFGDTICVDDVAQAAQTIQYEILTSVSPRVIRQYEEGEGL
jgi:alanine racemase